VESVKGEVRTVKGGLCLEYFLWDSDPEWNWSDELLIDLGMRECTQLGLITPGQVLDGTLVRAEMAYPLLDNLQEVSHVLGQRRL